MVFSLGYDLLEIEGLDAERAGKLIMTARALVRPATGDTVVSPMSEVTVKQFADVVGVPVERLLVQMKETGISVKSADAIISDSEKQQLLAYLRHHRRTEGAAAEPSKITVSESANKPTKCVNAKCGKPHFGSVDYCPYCGTAQTDVATSDAQAPVPQQSWVEQEASARTIPSPVEEGNSKLSGSHFLQKVEPAGEKPEETQFSNEKTMPVPAALKTAATADTKSSQAIEKENGGGSKSKLMLCPKCGKENADGVKFCGSCGASIAALGTPSHVDTSASVPGEQMTFGKAIATCMAKYVDFNGRASRPEYWWFFLFAMLLSLGSLIVDSSGIVSDIVNLALLLPALSAAARRLHDTNRSGWWMLIAFTIIGIIPLIIWLASKGNDQSNTKSSQAIEKENGGGSKSKLLIQIIGLMIIVGIFWAYFHGSKGGNQPEPVPASAPSTKIQPTPQVPDKANEAKPKPADGGAEGFSPQMMVQSLEQRLKDNPEDGEGWLTLAHSYGALERYAEARAAYAKALPLLGESADLLAGYAEVMVFSNPDRRIVGQPLELLQQALRFNPDHPKALWFTGMAAFQGEDYQGAVTIWRRLEKLIPDDVEGVEAIRQGIAEAEARAAQGHEAEPKPADGNADPEIQADGQVSQLVVEARQYIAEGNYKGAEDKMGFCLMLNKENTECQQLMKKAAGLNSEMMDCVSSGRDWVGTRCANLTGE